MSFLVEGVRVRYNEPPIGGPDGIVDGDEGTVLALIDADPDDDDASIWNVEFPECPFEFVQVSDRYLEEVES